MINLRNYKEKQSVTEILKNRIINGFSDTKNDLPAAINPYFNIGDTIKLEEKENSLLQQELEEITAPAARWKSQTCPAEVEEQADTRSYNLRTENGRILRLNRKQLRRSNKPFCSTKPPFQKPSILLSIWETRDVTGLRVASCWINTANTRSRGSAWHTSRTYCCPSKNRQALGISVC